MKPNTPNIYIVAPGANVLAVRKLKGLATALGIKAHLLNDIRGLPSIPEQNSVLVIPENLKIPHTDNHDQSWSKIFVLSKDPGFKHQSQSTIILDLLDAALQPQIQIFQGALGASEISTYANWYAAEVTGKCSFSDFPIKLASWAREFGLINYAPMNSVLTTCENLREQINKATTNYSLISDGSSIHFAIEISTSSRSEKELIREALQCPQAYLNIHQQFKHCIRAIIQSDLMPKQRGHLRIFELCDDKVDSFSNEEKEAS